MADARFDSRARAILIDDDEAILKLLTKIVETKLDSDLKIETCDSALEGQKRIGEETFDIILTDFSMPGMTGIELLRYSKQRNACSQVILLTGQSSRQTLLDAMEYGASDYLLKPINPVEFTKVMKEACERRSRWMRSLRGTLRKSTASGS